MKYYSPSDVLRIANENSVLFYNHILNRFLEEGYDDIQIYPNLIHMIIDVSDFKSPINTAINKRDYYKALTQQQNIVFKYFYKNLKIRNIIKKYNRNLINQLFNIQRRAINDKKINKYIHRKIKRKLIVFQVEINLIDFNDVGRIKSGSGNTLSGHRSLFLYNSNNNQGYFIDSEHNKIPLNINYKNKTYKEALLPYTNSYVEEFTLYKLHKIIPKILKINDLIISVPEYYCPQFKTLDNNCVFWTLLLAEEYIRYFMNNGKIDVEEILKYLYERYPTTNDLKKLIKTYKEDLLEIFYNQY